MEQITDKSLCAVVAELLNRLAPKFGDRESRALVREIFLRLKNWTPVDLAIRVDEEMSDFVIRKVGDVCNRLMNDEPIQYIFSRAHFYGMDFRVTPATLIPRPETATLVDIIVKENKGSDLRVLDLGTGSGCIAIALARNLRFPSVCAVDISAEALEVARGNASDLGTNIDFINADMLTAGFDNRYDIIVSNPPYIADSERESMERNVLDHEPSGALFVPDNDPLRFYNAVARIACESLADGGTVYLEINPLFARQLREIFIAQGFSDVEILKDLECRDRYAIVRR